jgi:hypothetical protein
MEFAKVKGNLITTWTTLPCGAARWEIWEKMTLVAKGMVSPCGWEYWVEWRSGVLSDEHYDAIPFI